MAMRIDRRAALRPFAALGTIGLAAAFAPGALLAAKPARPVPMKIAVWKSPTCGCCTDWIAHVRSAGFEVAAHDDGNEAARARLGIRPQFGSCHTALVGGYAIEGHVHADDIRRLLARRPDALGLAVPGMPIGSPGMDGPEYGGRREPHEVLLLMRDGGSRIFRKVS